MRTDIAKPQHGAPVGHDGYGICLPRIRVGRLFILRDHFTGFCHARRIGQRQIFPRLNFRFGHGFQLTVPLFM